MPFVVVLEMTVLGSFTENIASRPALFAARPVVVPLATTEATVTVTVFVRSRSTTLSVPLAIRPALVSAMVAALLSPFCKTFRGTPLSPQRWSMR